MEILKYLDVLIGLAVVMILLSPMVSALTQIVLWAFKVRPVRLRLALSMLIKQLNGTSFDLYDTAIVTGLPATALQLEFDQPAPQLPVRVPVVLGSATLTTNFATMLRASLTPAGQADLRPALRMVTAGPVPQDLPAAAVIRLQPAGTQDFRLTSSPAGANGDATVKYRYDGPIQLASRQFTAAVAPAAGRTVASIAIDSGPFKGTLLQLDAAGVYTYPDNVRPMPASHDLKIILAGAGAGDLVTLAFAGDRSLDRNTPVPDAVGLLESECKDLADQVLTHPMIGKPPSSFKWLRKWNWLKWGELVEREELIRILLELAAKNPRLRALLAQSGIADPERALDGIRQAAQRLEAEQPQTATHDRLTQAILEGARSSFVGRINGWFDQVMDRTTSEYRFRAQLVTVIAAFFVASAVQMDSIDLLRRLSTDDKLRESLVNQAQQQQTRVENQTKKPAAEQNGDEIQLAKTRRDEIEANLAKLRDPQLSVLPDHFIWQALPKARLMFNEAWSGSHPPQKLELVLGPSVVNIEPRWSSDFLTDIEDAIRSSGAPVTLSRDSRNQYTVTGPGIDTLQIKLGVGERAVNGISQIPSLARTSLSNPAAAVPAAAFFLVVGYDPHYKVPVAAPLNNANLAKALKESHAAISVKPIPGAGGTVTDIALEALKPETRWIELRVTEEDPKTTILKPTEFSAGSATYDEKLGDEHPCAAIIGSARATIDPCDAPTASTILGAYGFAVSMKTLDHLVLTSRRLGTLQLRAVPGKSESNILNKAEEWSCESLVCFDQDLFSRSWRGILLTWILLSLGAPFWYDTLKDLLKLRSSLAKKEEDARIDRQTTSPPAPTKAKT